MTLLALLEPQEFMIEHAIEVNASAEIVWQHVTEVDIASFRHPAYFALLGIPKPLRAEVVEPGLGGVRTAYFSNGLHFAQTITEWQPYEQYAFTFQAAPGFRVGYVLDLSSGPFQMKAGAYHLAPHENGVYLSLFSRYQLRGAAGMALFVPVWAVLSLFQRYLLRGIKANAERQALAGKRVDEAAHA